MTKKEKQLWLEAIGEVRAHYKQYPLDEIPPSYNESTGKNCPLCKVSMVFEFKNRGSRRDTCSFCLWVKFEEASCMTMVFSFDTTQQRLNRLDRWEARILKGD